MQRRLIDPFLVCRSELVPAYVRLLKDNEAEVRIAAAGKVAKFCGIVTPQQALATILPCVKVRLLSGCSPKLRSSIQLCLRSMKGQRQRKLGQRF